MVICIWLVLQCAEQDFFSLLAVVCSSWSPVNIATSKRSVAYPSGNTALAYVAEANCMCARSVLIALLIAARGGTFFVEQPGGSYMEYYDKMQWLFDRLPVYKVRWWMGHYGHVSPKRHKAFTNNKWAAKFNLGKMKLKRFRASQDPQDKPTVRYVDKRGRSRFHGNASLKLSQWPGVIGREPKSEPHSSDPFSIDPKHGLAHECAASFLPRVYPVRFGWKTVELMPKLKSRGQGRPVLPETLPSGPEIFNAMSWHTEKDWSDARLKPVLVYLKGNRSLNLPDSWKAVFPRHV
ncbi:unnamed protein product [Durusdinium trenchii]|uniref:Uncharacterized protein n=1 Tax=Durusdinium trenchii TaxID=1381693 RepID=A0ABP0NJX3_9DINO